MSEHPENPFDSNFRQTGKFRPINDPQQHSQEEQKKHSFKVNFINSIYPLSAVKGYSQHQNESQWWRLYFQEPLSSTSKEELSKTVERCFKIMSKNNQLEEHKSSQIFLNINGVLIERLRGFGDQYYTSNLDYNCLLVLLKVENSQKSKTNKLECFQISTNQGIKNEKEYVQEIFIKLKQDFCLFYLISKGSKLYIVKEKTKELPKLQLSQQYLEESVPDICKNTLIIKNLSPRIISIKFLEQNLPQNTEPLQIKINNTQIYQSILYRINRIKYIKFKMEEAESKQWHSFDQKLKVDYKKQNKTTPEKAKKTGKPNVPCLTINKKTNDSTNFVEQEHETFEEKRNSRGNILNQPKHMKISQKIMTNMKESNLVASDLDYPASLKDQNEKEGQYIDDFENLLYEEEEGGGEKQLSLNDSFEEFQKKENSVKTKQILQELNKRKEKEKEEKRLISSLKEKVGELINQENELIDSNIKLKMEIKRLQKGEGVDSQQSRELDEIRQKINQLKKYQRKLVQQLSNIKADNNIEVLVFGQPNPQQQKSSQSQRSNKKMVFNSVNAFPIMKNLDPLTSSIRSDKGQNNIKKFPPNLSPQSSMKKLEIPPTMNSNYVKQSYMPQGIQHLSNMQKGKEMQLNLYSSVPATQSFIHPASTKNLKSMGMKFNSPLTPSPGLNPSGSSKNIQDVTSSFPNNCQSPFLLSQNSEKKLKMPFGEGNKK